MFGVYLELGFEHLLDLRGYDHILFIAGLCAAYSLTRWRELLVLVTAFTIGHSVSLALATLRLVSVNSSLVEFLIPVTIVATALTNLAGLGREGLAGQHRVAARPLRYALALGFGLIHGLGFSNFLRIALGDERNLFVPLLSFNIGRAPPRDRLERRRLPRRRRRRRHHGPPALAVVRPDALV